MTDVGLRRCGHCGAFDAWTGRQRRDDLGVVVIGGSIIVIEHECGVCGRWWRVPIRPREILAGEAG